MKSKSLALILIGAIILFGGVFQGLGNFLPEEFSIVVGTLFIINGLYNLFVFNKKKNSYLYLVFALGLILFSISALFFDFTKLFNASSRNNPLGIQTCQEGKQLARQDFESGKYRYAISDVE